MSSTAAPLRLTLWVALLAGLGAAAELRAEAADVVLEPVAQGLADPVHVTRRPGDGRFFVSLLRGRVVVVRHGEVEPRPFLDVTGRVPPNGQGLVSIAFHPDFAANGFVFLHRLEIGTRDLLITRFQVSADDPDRVDPDSEVVLVRVSRENLRHSGGQVAFGPDGYLYASTGDGIDGAERAVAVLPSVPFSDLRHEDSDMRLPSADSRRSIGRFLLPFLAVSAVSGADVIRAELSDVVLEIVSDQVVDPADLLGTSPGRVYVTQLRGQVMIVDGGVVLGEPLLDVADRIPPFGHGLQSVALHPSGDYVYLHRLENGTQHLLITRFSISAGNPNRVDPESEVVLVRVPKERFQHFGGRVRFGPDGFLYVTTGDDSEGGNINDPECSSQSLDRFEGKILRLDVDQNVDTAPYYGIPPDNPFVGTGRPEIWATGLRNPWRFSFDSETGDLWLGDVGESDFEEVNLQPATSSGGENYGWKIMEGTSCFFDTGGCGVSVPACNSPSYTLPVIEYTHADGNCAVTGGLVYRGSLVPDLFGRYLYGDFCSGRIWAARQVAGVWESEELPLRLPTVVSFTADATGEVFLSAEGAFYRLVDPTVPAAGVVEMAVTRTEVREGAGQVLVSLRRVGEGSGAVSVRVRRTGGTAGNAELPFDSAVVQWADGETGRMSFPIPVVDDTDDEDDETAVLELDLPEGGAILGPRTSAEVVILDDDEPSCVPDASHLCLNGGRFRVSVTWRTAQNRTGSGNAVTLGEDSGMFWFFSSNNPEVFVKLLDACFDPFHHFWVFAAGLTDVETRLEVIDTLTGEVRRYDRPLGASYEAVRDTSAFATCP